MFTGIIEKLGLIKSINAGAVFRIQIDASELAENVRLGDSVAVNGVCLTVSRKDGTVLSFDAVRETINRTSLSALKIGDAVNLETALTLNKPLGGHFVSGHVDGLAAVHKIVNIGDSAEIIFDCPPEIMRYIAVKGSVAIDGISLTVARAEQHSFCVAVIPHTLSQTTLFRRKAGDKVNIETDILAKYTEKLLSREESDGLAEVLVKNGFM